MKIGPLYKVRFSSYVIQSLCSATQFNLEYYTTSQIPFAIKKRSQNRNWRSFPPPPVSHTARPSSQRNLFVDDPKENAAFLPFGSGSHACVGQKFAILAITTLFASLLQNYEIKLQPGSVNDPKPTMNNCMLQPSPKIMLVKRNC